MSVSHNKAKMFLEGLHRVETQSIFEQLTGLIEILENKTDPDPTEIRLVSNLYSFIEKLNILESNLTSYSKESGNNMGNKLTSLYEKISSSGNYYRD
jgi:hypothetical protein